MLLSSNNNNPSIDYNSSALSTVAPAAASPPRSGWLGIVGNPIKILVECLLEVSRGDSSGSPSTPSQPQQSQQQQQQPQSQTQSQQQQQQQSQQICASNNTNSNTANSNSNNNSSNSNNNIVTNVSGNNNTNSNTVTTTTTSNIVNVNNVNVNNVNSTKSSSSSSSAPFDHVAIDASDLPDRSYLSLSLRIAVLALCQQRCMPPDKHQQERCLNQETRLLELLASLPKFDSELSVILVQCLQAELGCVSHSALSPNLPANAYPMHCTGNFLFKWLLSINQDLAYSLVRRAMRLPILESHSDQHHPDDQLLLLPPPPYRRIISESILRPQFHLSIPPQPQQQQQPPQQHSHHQQTHSHHQQQHHTHQAPLLLPPAQSQSTQSQSSSSINGRWPVLRRVESAQCELALTMVQAARDSSQRLDQVLKICDRHIHSSTSLFKLSQEICSKCFMNAHLRCAVFHLALNVASRTLRRSHWRRREMVQWLISCAVPVGTVGILHLVANWRHYITPKEAVLQVASTLLGPTPGLSRVIVESSHSHSHSTANGAAPISVTQDERVRREVRKMALEAASKDPLHCGMRALSLSEKDPHMFEATYQAIYDAAERGAIGPAELFSLGRYLDPRSNRRKAYALALFAINYLQPVEVQDVCPVATDHDISWACMLAHGLGTEALSEMIGQLVRKVRAPLLLAEILHRCRLSPILAPPHQSPHDPSDNNANRRTTNGNNSSFKVFLSVSEPPLQLLLNATVEAFFSSTQLRLANISPRHYNDFLEFLCKARDVFLLIVPGGVCKFKQLIDSIRHSHRGKRKLNSLLKDRFLFDSLPTATTTTTTRNSELL